MKWCGVGIVLAFVLLGLPQVCLAQTDGWLYGEMKSLQQVLDDLYKEMLPKCDKLIGIGRGIAGFAATFYIGNRVWRHIANAEAVDFYPLFRPFATGLAILLYPFVLSIIDGVLKPTVTGTATLVNQSDENIRALFAKKEQEMKNSEQWKALVGASQTGDYDLWLKYAHPDIEDEGWGDAIKHSIEFIFDKMAYNFKNDIRYIISVVLELLYAAAALCINTLRTFNLIILAILGPLVLGISVFDGFHHTINVYMARFINVYLWLPIANILHAVLGEIQANMLKMDLAQIASGGQSFFNSHDIGYMIFMVIGIIAFTTVPSIADQVVMAGGGGALQHKITGMAMGTMAKTATVATSAVPGVSMARDMYGDTHAMMRGGAAASGSDYFKDKLSG